MTTPEDPLLNAYLASPDPDSTLREQMDSVIHAARSASGANRHRVEAGAPLRIFLAGYAGAGNAGADIRVGEMIRQFEHIFQGSAQMTLSVLDPRLATAFPLAVQQKNMTFLPRFLPAQIAACDVVVACEGSMFKSNFSDAISLVMLGALGLGVAEGKLAVGYGAEAGALTPEMEAFAREHCRGALITCRNASSQRRIESLGLLAAAGTDTAWTYEPSPSATARQLLSEAGWNGTAPIVTVCPVNPFWWPVRPDPLKYQQWMQDKRHSDYHYGFFYFHNDSAEAAQKTRTYLQALAGAVSAYCKESGAFPVIVGMDKVDQMACRDFAALLPAGAPVFARPDIAAADIVGVLRESSVLVSSRFHSIVCAMPAGVPAIGVSYDERIENLMADGGNTERVLRVDEPALEEALLQRLRQLDAPKAAETARKATAENLRRLGEMSRGFAEEVTHVYPDFPLPSLGRSWESYLPPLDPVLRELLNTHPPRA